MTLDPTDPATPPESPPIPLVLAGHGTRDRAGIVECLALADRVRSLLPGVRVEAAFVELTPPTIESALASVLDDGADGVVVVPLMIGAGGHVRADIPEAIEAGRHGYGQARVVCSRHLGAPAPMVSAALQRIERARGDWDVSEVGLVVVGRGCSVTDANADHVRLTRLLQESGGYAHATPAFIQVTLPSVAEALDMAHAVGHRKLVVMPHYLFPGRLTTWVRDAASEWALDHPHAHVRVADPIGDSPELAGLVVTRYRESARTLEPLPSSPAYLAGLLLRGRKVVVVGGGTVAHRRIPALLAAGAEVTLVAPDLHPALQPLVTDRRIRWHPRGFRASDVEDAWYVLAATDDHELNAAVAASAEKLHTFCVRADRATLGSAWTPATGAVGGATIAVLSDRDPKRSATLRDQIIKCLGVADESI